MKEKVEKTHFPSKPSASLISRMSSKKSTRHGEKPQRVTTVTYSPRNWWAVPQLLQVLLNVDQLLFKVAVEEIGAH